MKFLIIVGARPNFIKISSLMKEIKKYSKVKPILVHTGQHYNFEMSQIFFEDLNIPKPHYNLCLGSGSHAYQIGKAIIEFDKIILKEKPSLVVVVGDANASLVGALDAAKNHIPVAHIEAGLRSFDMLMPEEINRCLTDHISDYLFVTESSGIENLLNEGISKRKIYFVGNIMIDTLKKFKIKSLKLKILRPLKLQEKKYAVLTLHRQENVDDKKVFEEFLETVANIQNKIRVIWPIHPRAKKQIKKFNLNFKIEKMKNVTIIKPLGYFDMLSLNSQAKFVLTDSGGIQEETTFLKVPCLTLRESTERPVTIKEGTNILCGRNKEKTIKEVERILKGEEKKGKIPKLWDGRTSQRIVEILLSKNL